MTYSLYFDVSGLSFAARAGLATITAFTYENQEAEVPVKIIKHALGLSDEAWLAIYDELYEAGLVFMPPDRYGNLELVELMSAFHILSSSMGPSGRPSAKDWLELKSEAIAEHGARCTYCDVETSDLHLDHVVPLARGGSSHRANLVPACKSCNSAKGSKSWEEWYPLMLARRR